MDVGVNYPWVDYGWDFGVAPPGARVGNDPNWLAQIDHDLGLFLKIGISVVRWFILGDGLTYGSSVSAPRWDESTGKWRFDPPKLSAELLSHFEQLLVKFSEFNRKSDRPILLMPVLIDYLFCQPGVPIVRKDDSKQQSIPDEDWVKRGRADAITDSAKQAEFLRNVLQPLLQTASKFNPSVIYAWDIINEPELITNNWHPDGQRSHPVDDFAMRAFIEDSKSMIRYFNFKPTIGFYSLDTMRRTRINADINQFHYYNHPTKESKLEKNPFSPPGIVGEFATDSVKDFWPDLRGQSQTVLNRLRFSQAQGYRLALPWRFNDKKDRDDHTSWTPEVEQQFECFVFGRNCPKK